MQSRNPGRAAAKPERPERSSRELVILAVLLIVYTVVSLLSFNPSLHTGGDNAHYMILARSMLSGKGYRDIYKPDEPLHTLYPFGYPLLLVPVMALFKGSFVALKILSLLLGAGSVVVVFLLIRDDYSQPVVWSVVGLFATGPLLLEYSHWILSDVSFTFFSLLSLVLVRRSDRHDKRFSAGFAAAFACAVFAYFIRPVGMALVVGVLAHLFLRRRYRRGLIALAILVILVAPWTARNMKASGEEGYVAPLVLKNPYDKTSGRVGPGDLMNRVRANAETYFLAALPRTVVSSHRRIWPLPQRTWIVSLVGLAVSTLVLVGFVEEMIRRRRFLHYYLILFVGMLLVWPEVWATDRFILPLVPFALLYFLKGGLLLFRRAPGSARRRMGFAVATILALGNLHLVASGASGNVRLIREYASGSRMTGYSADWVNFFETAIYASRFTSKDAVFLVRKPGLFYLFAERKCVAYPFTPEKEEIIGAMEDSGVSYVVVDAFAWTRTTMRYLIPAILAHEEEFELVYATQEPRTLILGWKRDMSRPEEEPRP